MSAIMRFMAAICMGENTGEGAIRIAELFSVMTRISGSNFAIMAIEPEIQALSRNEVTEWKWEVKPTSEGSHSLHLTLSALLDVDGERTPRAIRTFDKTIDIKVTWLQRASLFFAENWQWLWAAILVPMFGLVWRKRKEARAQLPSNERWGIRMRRRWGA
jgi:hypothetical protein